MGAPDIHRYLGLAAAAEGKVQQAAQCFQRAWELRPDDVMLSLQLSRGPLVESSPPVGAGLKRVGFR